MKKIVIGSALMLLSIQAQASTARLLALGMNEVDNDGVYYIQDARNVFLNPAWVNVYSNMAVMEYGNQGLNLRADTVNDSTNTAANVWQNSTPKAQGGLFKKFENYVVGAYLGDESNTSALLRTAASSTASVFNNYGSAAASAKLLQTTQNQLDLFFGMDTGLKYGIDVIYSGSKDDTRSGKDSALALRTGVIGKGWDANLNLSLLEKSDATDTVNPLSTLGATSVTQEFKGKFGIQGGGSYSVTEHSKVFGYVKHFAWQQSDSYNNYATLHGAATDTAGQFGTVTGDFTAYYVGWGAQMPVNNGDSLFLSVQAKEDDIDLNFTNKAQVRHFMIPVVIGYEAKATEWLTVRGSIVQDLYGQKHNGNEESLNPIAQTLISTMYGSDGKATLANSTTVNAGATLTFGNLSIDGLIGTTSGNRTTGAVSSLSGTSKGVLTFDNLLTTVGMNYKF